MKKSISKSRKKTSKPILRTAAAQTLLRDKSFDMEQLDQDVSEEFRDTTSHELPVDMVNHINWTEAQDRSEDLADVRDPFIQEPELDTSIPPELIQHRAYHLYEQRLGNSQDNLADWFEAERQIRKERADNLL